MAQLGTDHAHIRNFRAKAKTALQKIRVVYPGLIIGSKLGGFRFCQGPQLYRPGGFRQGITELSMLKWQPPDMLKWQPLHMLKWQPCIYVRIM